MAYNSTFDVYTLNVVDFSAAFIDRHTYVGMVNEHVGGTHALVPFKLSPFSVESDSFEQVLMRLPFQVEITGGTAYIKWYADTTFTGPALFQTEAYENGVGTTFATLPERVTHRGPIVAIP